MNKRGYKDDKGDEEGIIGEADKHCYRDDVGDDKAGNDKGITKEGITRVGDISDKKTMTRGMTREVSDMGRDDERGGTGELTVLIG